MQPITIDWASIEAIPGTFRVELRSYPNPDFGEVLPRKGPESAQGTLLEVFRATRAYASGLGGGNWGEPVIYRLVGESWERFARVSYNGRIWPPTPWQPGASAMYEDGGQHGRA